MKALINQLLKKSANPDIKSNSESVTQSQSANLTGKHNWLVGMISTLLVLIFIFFLHEQLSTVSHLATNQTAQTRTILNQLNDINDQLQQLSSSPQNSRTFQQALITMNTDVSSIQKSINTLAKASEVQKVSDQLISIQSDLDAQMLDLKRVVANNSKDYLDPQVLPFHVISIDVISQQPFISIDYDHHLTPLTIGDSMAGWIITAADYDAGWVEFKNDHNQYVKVSLQG